MRVPPHFKCSLPLARYLDDNIEGEVLRHVACVGQKKNVYMVLVRKPERKTTLEV